MKDEDLFDIIKILTVGIIGTLLVLFIVSNEYRTYEHAGQCTRACELLNATSVSGVYSYTCICRDVDCAEECKIDGFYRESCLDECDFNLVKK
jgi:hypothetical protein